MLQASTGGSAGRLTLWNFQPELKHTHFAGEDIEPVRAKLRALIGRIAGVGPGMGTPLPEAEQRELGRRLVKVLEQFGPMVTLIPIRGGPDVSALSHHAGAGREGAPYFPLGEDVVVQLRSRSRC